jgi:phage terminase large subunit-like protein
MVGAQLPRVSSVPPYSSSLGVEAVELAARAGLVLDPWQALVLEEGLGRRDDDKWSAFEVGVVVSRQNGKGGILEARELAGLFLLDERFIVHSAHQFDTSLEAFRRLLMLIEDTPELDAKVKRVSRSHGEEGIELVSGQRIRFRTRTKGGGRGFSCDCLILDEAMFLPESSHGALLPTLSARPNPQVWYTASAVDQDIHEHGVVLSRVRQRGLKGNDPSLAYFEWSTEAELDRDVAADREAWAVANPGLGIRISEEHVEYERASMDPQTFAVERLGIGNWPPTDGSVSTVIDLEQWQSLVDTGSSPVDSLCFAFDVTPSRGSASIGVAGKRADGLAHIEVVDQREGTGWLVERLVELNEKHRPVGVFCDAFGPAGSIVDELLDLGVPVQSVTSTEHGRACAMIFDTVEQGGLRHLGTTELRVALRGAKTRQMAGDSWLWARKKSNVDISPLVAVTLALWAAMREQPSVYESREAVAV